jgi:hypothetical protein
MSHRSLFRTGLLLLVLVLLGLTAGAAFAQGGDTKQVALIVTFPDGKTQTQVVTVPSKATTLDALRATKLSVATSESAQGASLCKINDTGCPADNCFCDAQHFWAYYHLNGNAWASAAEGAGTYVPGDRAVEGFAWSDFDAEFNPNIKPPVSTFEQVATAQAGPTAAFQPVVMILLVLLVIAVVVVVIYLLRARKRA